MGVIEMNIPKLGFGTMRLPVLGNDTIDMPQFIKMVDCYMANGMSYFDTAYKYHNGEAEKAIKTAVVERYPRDSFKIATKLPIWWCDAPSDMARIFNEQLGRCGVEYFDMYLIHAMSVNTDNKLIDFGGYEFLNEMKAQGKIKCLGFSFHGDAHNLEKVLTERPEMEFVQLQINYYNWRYYQWAENAEILYRIARKYNKPVIVMEPVWGGALANLPQRLDKMITDTFSGGRHTTPAAMALRFCGSLDGVVMILSGMSDLRQLEENVKLFKDFKPLATEERDLLFQVADELDKYYKIGCTECNYCECPAGISIAKIFKIYNAFLLNENVNEFKKAYEELEKCANLCTACAKCEAVCPQGIKIIEKLTYISKTYEELDYDTGIENE